MLPDRLWTTKNGQIVFDTNDRLFFATDFITGSKSIPQRADNNYTERTFNLSSCHPLATKAIGMFQVLLTGGYQPAGTPGFGWFNAGGTYVHLADGAFGNTGDTFWQHANMHRLSTYTFTCGSGLLKLTETIQLAGHDSNEGQRLHQSALTMHYRIWCGLFDQ